MEKYLAGKINASAIHQYFSAQRQVLTSSQCDRTRRCKADWRWSPGRRISGNVSQLDRQRLGEAIRWDEV